METQSVYCPISWRSIIQDPSTLNIFCELYEQFNPPITSQVLECLVYFVSIRRTLFSTSISRSLFLNSIIKMICSIISTERGLNDDDTYHMLCRLLGRLKGNYQLADLVALPEYNNWIHLVTGFTILSLQNSSLCENGIQYLLMLWNRLITAVPVFKRNDDKIPETYFDELVPSVYLLFIIDC